MVVLCGVVRASLVRISFGFSPQASISCLSWSIFDCFVLGLMHRPEVAYFGVVLDIGVALDIVVGAHGMSHHVLNMVDWNCV